MIKIKRKDDVAELPEPIALTVDQLKEVATATAGGLCCVAPVVIRAGGIPAKPM